MQPVSCVPSLRSCRSLYSPMHGVHQGVDPYNGNVIPLFMQGMSQLGQISGGIWAPPNPPIQFVPQVFNRGQIWTECWPIERIYVVVSQKLLTNSSDMGPGISGRLSCSLALMGGQLGGRFCLYTCSLF